MPRLASFSHATWSLMLTLLLASACGGRSSKSNGGEAGTGGVPSQSGSGSVAGKASAGSSNGGASGSGNLEGPCAGPSELGTCSAAFARWTHDDATGICRPTMYGGCGATLNNYETLEACQEACPSNTPDYDACEVSTDCVVTGTGCCGVCDGPEVTAHDLMAYNKRYAAEAPECPNRELVLCGACPEPVTWQATLHNFVPNCVRGQCVVEDVRVSAVSACSTSDDCRLHHGTGCCDNCGNEQRLAVRNDGSFEQLVCGEFLPPCDPCEPNTRGYAAMCGGTGHCEIVVKPK